MSDRIESLTTDFMELQKQRHAGEPEFLRALEDVVRDVVTVEKADSGFTRAKVLERLAEPDRVIGFRVVWQDDRGAIHVNRGWRVQHSNLLGPYKGGLRFHRDVTRSVMKFLAFEQTLKNALTVMPLGGAKGGADFDPSGRSDAEIARFCQAFMAELAHHIGPWRDVPAGDIGVGAREVGYLYAAYKRHARTADGAMTGKPICLGGSELRVEATGYGLVYFLCAMLERCGTGIEEKRVAVSGKGNVARHAARKVLELGGKVVTLSDSHGLIEAADGLTHEALDWIAGRAEAGKPADRPPRHLGLRYVEGAKAWRVECDIALPCATQNELDEKDAAALIENGCRFLAEGANMPVTGKAVAAFDKAGVVQAPGKASNAGGVAVSCLEMSQNAAFRCCSADEVDSDLRDIMVGIHELVVAEAGRSAAGDSQRLDYRRAANVAAYRRLAQALVDSGPV